MRFFPIIFSPVIFLLAFDGVAADYFGYAKAKIASSLGVAAVINEASPVKNPTLTQFKESKIFGGKYTLKIAAATNQGARKSNEDIFWIVDGKLPYCAVFDGHGGTTAAELAQTYLYQQICQCTKNGTNVSNETIKLACNNSAQIIDDAGGDPDCGSTALAAFLSGDEESSSLAINLVQVGDSDAISLSLNENAYKAIRLTKEHKLQNPEEETRFNVKNIYTDKHGRKAIEKQFNERGKKIYLKTTRGFGHSNLYDIGFGHEPYLISLECTEKSSLIVLATKGLWDNMSPDDVAAYVSKLREENTPLDSYASRLLEESARQDQRNPHRDCLEISKLFSGTHDNTTIVFIAIGHNK